MFEDILSEEQKQLLPFIESFKKEFYLVGGTSIALQIGHRESIDFDLFKISNISKVKITNRLNDFNLTYRLIYTDSESFHMVISGVKITFFQYPFKIKTNVAFQEIKMPDLLHLGAMKAYALGRRAKWKNYFDLYFILKDYHTLEEINKKSQEIYKDLFSPKLFSQQLCFFSDIDYSEPVSYCIAPVPDEVVKSFLIELVTQKL